MKRSRFLIFLSLCLVLAACTASGDIEIPNEQTITAEAALALPPTLTPPPSATPRGTATNTPPPTSAPSETASPGPSPTGTAPQLPEGDPRTGLNLSVPDYEDDFTRQFQWAEFIYEEAATNLLDLENGYLRTTDHNPDTYITWSKTDLTATNFYAQIQAQFGECSGKDSAGLGFRLPAGTLSSGYTLEVSCDGMYRVRKFLEDAPPVVLQDWTPSDKINQESGSENLIGVHTRGGILTPIINNKSFAEIEDYSFLQGTFGVFSSSYETTDLTVIFDNFRYWYAR
jgi:hypothetical protein